MKHILLNFLVFTLNITLFAQTSIIKTNVNKDEDINVILSSSRLLFSGYELSTVFMKAGTAQAKMNYNMLTDEMLFVDAKNDTLALSNLKDIEYLKVGESRFVYTSKGYAQILTENNDKKLLIKRRIKPTETKQYGGYGVALSTSIVTNVDQLDFVGSAHNDNLSSGSTHVDKLGVRKEVVYNITITYFLNSGKSIYAASEKGFQKLFAKLSKEIITSYIKEHNLNLKKEDDIVKLFNYCATQDKK